MKNILTVFAVLAMASVANAGLSISVNGVVNPQDSSINLDYTINETAVIDIHADQTAMAMLLIQGPGAIDAANPTNLWEQSAAANMAQADLDELIPVLAELGYPGVKDIISLDVVDASEPYTTPDGLVIDGLIFTCTDEGDVVLTLADIGLEQIFDTQTIHQIPEPLTLGLLGLGGLFLRRRR